MYVCVYIYIYIYIYAYTFDPAPFHAVVCEGRNSSRLEDNLRDTLETQPLEDL